MKYRKLGHSQTEVSVIGLGCDKFHPGQREAEFIALINHALDCGVTLFDTAPIYGNGSNESLLGRALCGRRHQALICTKFGHTVQPDGRVGGGGRPDLIFRSCEQSLKALGTDYIDLFCQHLYDPLTPVEDTIGALVELVAQGKIRYLGLSNAPVDIIRRAHAVHPISMIQSEYSLWTRFAEQELLPAARALGITYVAYWPLALGLLAGSCHTPTDMTGDRFRPLYQRANLTAGNEQQVLDRLKALDAIATARDRSPAQIALAWILGSAYDIVPIPNTLKRKHLDQNLAAIDIDLTASERQSLDAIATG